MIHAVKVLSVPAPVLLSDLSASMMQQFLDLLREDNIGPDAAGASLLREVVGVQLGVHARRIRTAAKVGTREAAVALLHFRPQILRRASRRVSGKHAEALAYLSAHKEIPFGSPAVVPA